MGMCLKDFGNVSIEVRRESFIVHPSYGYTTDADGDKVHTSNSDHFGKSWRERPHPEFMLEDLDDLIKALQDAKKYVEARR
jgi:hypothetical protein